MIANETFCDSVQIWTDQSFDSYLWSTGETDSLITVSATTASAITLSGTVNKSDGTTCSLTSDGTLITINTTPTITITNNSGTVDYDGTNAISLTAGTSGSSTSFLWSNGATTSAVSIAAQGTYQVVGTDAGCSDSVSLRVYEPVYVDDDGSDSNGDGSLNLPYATLSKGYTEVSDGGKIYVLPGTYEEELEITKSVNIMSNYGRLGDTSAIATTIIESDNSNYALKINSAGSVSEPVLIQGFTITGKSSNSYEAAVHAQSGAVVELRNIIFEENKVLWGFSEPAAALSVDGATVLIEESSFVDNNPLQMNNPSVVSLRSSSKLTVKRCSFKDNYSDYSIISLWQGGNTLNIENSYFKDNISYDGLIRSRSWDDAISLDHVTIQESLNTGDQLFVTDGNSSITVSNSVVQSTNSGTSLWYSSNSSGSMSVSNSVIDVTGGLNQPNSQSSNVILSNNVLGAANILSDGSLDVISAAIGLGSVGLNFDFDNNTRPNPVGSNPDAGAFENNRAQGDFDATIQDCGYLLTANVLNSSSYSLSWRLAGQEVSTSNSFLATTLGVYSLTVTSVDRVDTITKNLNLNDPLRFDVISYGNSCSAVSNSNGFIQWGNIQGGTQYTDDWYDYRTALNNEAGSLFDGYWNLDNGSSWSYNRDNMQDGKFYVFVEDGSGCVVGDTIEIVEQARDTYYVSTTGSNSNTGTSASDAFASIATAVDYACTNDTIILLDGTYYEDSLEIDKNLVIGSEYLFDNDTNHIAATIIDGENDGWIMRWESGSSWSDTATNQLVGLTIQNGNSTNSGYAGGVKVEVSRVLLIDHAVFKNNQNNQNGGGALWTVYDTRIALKDVVFDGNSSSQNGSGWYSGYSRSYSRNLVFKNHAIGYDVIHVSGAREFDVADVKILNNVTTQHTIRLNLYDLQSDAVLSNWEVRNNTAQNRLVYIDDGSRDGKKSYYNNWLVADNTSTGDHPGINFMNSSGKYVFNNLTVWNNITSGSGASNLYNSQIYHEYSNQSTEIIITNSIIGSTNGYALTSQDWNTNTTISVDYSFIEGGASKTDGGTNTTISLGSSNVLSASPYFTDAANGDYSLSNVSTLLGAGASTATVGGVSITAPPTDLFGNSRPNPAGTTPDIGAIESPDSSAQVGMALVVDNNGFCETASGTITANLLNYTGTATYAWSSTTYPTWTWNATQSATGLSSGDYKVIAIDATSGVKIDSTEITLATLPAISITNTSSDATCFGDNDAELTFEIYGGNPLGGSQYTYSVDYMEFMAQATGVVIDGNYFDTDNTSSARTNKYVSDNWNGNPNYQGKYYVSVSDQDGCTFTDTVEIGYNHALPVVSITTLASDGTVGLTSMCEGTGNVINLTAGVTGGGGTNTFSWSNASTSATVGVALTDSYTVEVTDQYTCVGKDTLDVYFQSSPEIIKSLASASGSVDFELTDSYADSWNGALVQIINSSNTVLHTLGSGFYSGNYSFTQSISLPAGDYSVVVSSVGNYVNEIGLNVSVDGAQLSTYSNTSTTTLGTVMSTFTLGGDPLVFNETFCDSVQLYATPMASASSPGFTDIYWVNALNDTVSELETKTFYADTDLTLYGVFVRSDGQTCVMTSSLNSFDVNASPNLLVTNYSGSNDLNGGDTIVLVASADVGTLSWIDSSGTVFNNDTLYVTSPGTYTARSNSTNCESVKEISITQLLYVAKTGNDVTGNGFLTNPYKTIQTAIDSASEGQKIYVLPGNYAEGELDFETSSGSGVYKSVYLASDLLRLDDSTAIAATKIDADGDSYLFDIDGANSSTIQGFTLKGVVLSGMSSSVINLADGANVVFRDIIITGNTSTTQQVQGAAMNISGSSPEFDNVIIENFGSDVAPLYGTSFIHNYSSVVFTDVIWRNNYADQYGIVTSVDNTSVTLINSLLVDNGVGGDMGVLNQYNNSKMVLINSTVVNNLAQEAQLASFWNSNNELILLNSILGISIKPEYQIYNNSGNNNSVYARNSVLPQGVTGSNQVSKITWDVDATNLFVDPQLNNSGFLKANSPAIGIGSSAPLTVGDTTYSMPVMDLAGVTRPNPFGSNPDAGAYESDKAIGDFDMNVSSCGYTIAVGVLNSTVYDISITGPGGFTGSQEFTNVTLKGTYSVTVTDSVSGTSITKGVSISNILNIGYTAVKDACVSNGGLGTIEYGDFDGGTRYNDPNDTYSAYTLNIGDTTNLSSVISNQNVPDKNWGWNDSRSVAPGMYVLSLTDASGCTIYDTLIVGDAGATKLYLSTTGSDTADGSYTHPLATIQEALNRTCDGDSIILFDGEYFENVDITNSAHPYVTIASQYLEDGMSSHIDATIVNGMDEDPVFNISDHNSTTDTVLFVGFTITNGKASNWYGGGGISGNYSNIALKNMVVSGNRSGSNGGGIGTDGGELNLWNTIIEDNIAQGDGGGIRIHYGKRLDGHNSTVVRNNKSSGSNGGGISFGYGYNNETEDFYVKGFEVINNSASYNGGGVSIDNWGYGSSSLIIEDMKVINNRSLSSYGTGGMYLNNNGEDAILRNVIIASNLGNQTGGLWVTNTDLVMAHTTIYKNNVYDGTSSNDQIKLSNNANVLFLNSAVGGQETVGSSTAHTFYMDDSDTTCDLTIANSIVSGGLLSIDNPYSSTITGSPIGQALYLVDPSQGDYMLSPVSQGLGAGAVSFTGVVMPLIDIMGVSRPNPVGTDPDVGAVESPLDTAIFGAAYDIRNNIACDPTFGRLKVIPLNGSGSYKYELEDITGTATFSTQQNIPSYTYTSLYSGDYEITITDLFDSSEFVDTVTISGKDSLVLNKNIVDEFCFGEDNGSITLSVSGGDGYYDYTWTTDTNSTWPKGRSLNNIGPDEYFVTVRDGDNCFIEDSVTINTLHSTPIVSITGNLNKGGTITQTTNPQVRACVGDLVTLDAGAGFISYSWTTVDELNSWPTQTLSASYEEGFYVTVIDSFGCSNTDTAEVFYVQRPAIYASNVNSNIGGSYQQVTSYIEGSSESTGFNSEPKPYGAGDRYAKMQFIIPASELIAEGLTDQTAINSLGFEVGQTSSSPIQGFKIKLKNTTANQVSSTFETGFTQVYGFNILTPGEGWNTHEFDQDFVWDGTKNLLVQVEYSNVAFSNATNTYLVGHSTNYNSSAVATSYSSSVANQTFANVQSWRPNIKFGIDKVQATDTLRVCDFTMLNTTDDYDTYSWLINGTSQSTQLRYSMSTPNVVILKTVDAASSCIMFSDTVQVLLDVTPSVTLSDISLLGCIGDTLTTSVDTVESTNTYQWSNGVIDTTAFFTESGDYYVYATSPAGCQGVDTVNVSINIPPDVLIELNGKVLTSTDGSLVADNSACDTTLILPYYSSVDILSDLNSSEWSTYSNEFLTWEYQQGWDSLVDYTGPNFDADSNYFGGFYQFDPASVTDQNKVGYLQLGCINLLGMASPELSFEYHMVDVYADSASTSDQMGTLALEVKAADDNNWTTLWQNSGTDTAYGWVEKTVQLSSYVNKTIQMRWKGTAGVGGPRSEMGLDNISISDSVANLSNISGRITPETVCEGDSLVANAVTNGTTQFTYAWSNGDTTSSIYLTTTGWYSVSVTDEKNCSVSSDSVFVTVNPAPDNTLVLSDTTQYCATEFDSLTITAVNGYNDYDWFSRSTATNPFSQVDTTYELLVDSLLFGTTDYYVLITDSIGCRSSSSLVELVKRVNPSIILSQNPALCYGDSTGQLSVMASGSVQQTGTTCPVIVQLTDAYGDGWNGGQVIVKNSSGAVIDTLGDDFTTGSSYIDTLMLGSGSSYSIEVSQLGNYAYEMGLNVISGGTTIATYAGTTSPSSNTVLGTQMALFTPSCSTSSTTPSVSSGGLTYLWSNGSDSATVENVATGWYTVAVTDSFSCQTVDSVFVSEPTQLDLTQILQSDVLCNNGSDGFADYSFTGGVGGYSYSWSDSTGTWSSDSISLTGAPASIYYLVALDSNGCSKQDTVIISEPLELVLTLDSTLDLSCFQSADGYAVATVTGGLGAYSYSIDGAPVNSLSDSALVSGAHTFIVIDGNGCSDSVVFTLTEPNLLTANTSVVQYFGGVQVSCNGETDGGIDVNVAGGTLPYDYLWNDNDTTQDRSMIGVGTYSMTVTDAQGCIVSISEVISEPTALIASSLVDSLECYGAQDASISYTVSGANAPYLSSWSGSLGTSVDSVLTTFQVDMTGASVSTNGMQLISNSGSNYSMSLIPILEDSVYRVTIAMAMGSTMEYRFFNGATAESVSSLCGTNIGGTFYRTVTVTSDTTFGTVAFSGCTLFSTNMTGAGIYGTRDLTGLSAGVYTMSFIDVNGCTVLMSDSIAQPDSLYISAASIVDASCPQTPDGFIDITVSGGVAPYSYIWNGGLDTTQDIAAAYGYYSVQITDAKGCIDSATYLIDAPFPYNDEELCVVTVDTTGVNLLVWDKTPGQRTADYIILRENASTQYASVGTNVYNNMSTYADQNSNPAVQPYRYKLVLQDSCGNYSDTSDYHATIHLQASPGIASNEVQLSWTAYEGKTVQTYYIYRWLSPLNRILVDSVSSNVFTYTDIYPVTTTITALLYEVGAKFVNGGCSPTVGKRATYANSMSNVLDWGVDGGVSIGTDEWVDVVLEHDLEIYPNPSLGRLNLDLKGAWEYQEDINIKVLDITGRVLATSITNGAGTVQFDFQDLPAGVYFINIITNEGRTIVKRFERIN